MPASAGTAEVFDQGLTYVKSNVDHITFLTGEPTDFSDADTLNSGAGKKLSELAISGSEITLQDDGAGGRELAIPKKGHIPDEAGDISHIALIDRSTNTLLVYTEHDDGAGSPVSVTADLAYNLDPTTVGIEDFTTS